MFFFSFGAHRKPTANTKTRNKTNGMIKKKQIWASRNRNNMICEMRAHTQDVHFDVCAIQLSTKFCSCALCVCVCGMNSQPHRCHHHFECRRLIVCNNFRRIVNKTKHTQMGTVRWFFHEKLFGLVAEKTIDTDVERRKKMHSTIIRSMRTTMGIDHRKKAQLWHCIRTTIASLRLTHCRRFCKISSSFYCSVDMGPVAKRSRQFSNYITIRYLPITNEMEIYNILRSYLLLFLPFVMSNCKHRFSDLKFKVAEKVYYTQFSRIEADDRKIETQAMTTAPTCCQFKF